MKRCFKVLMILFSFLCVSACSNNETAYNTRIVSSEVKPFNVSGANEEIIKANVMIFNNNYSEFLGVKYREDNSYGSGVIYKSDEQYYYALTNNHVVSYDYSYSKHQILVEDCFSNEYVGEVIYSDALYDLAVVRFIRNSELKVLNLSDDEIKDRDSIRSMGNPDSVKNVINNGMINCLSYINLNSDKSKVNFEVIVHSATIASGSSGGALLNSDNEIVGITFAGVFDKSGNFITGYAIPSEKIIEFLNN